MGQNWHPGPNPEAAPQQPPLLLRVVEQLQLLLLMRAMIPLQLAPVVLLQPLGSQILHAAGRWWCCWWCWGYGCCPRLPGRHPFAAADAAAGESVGDAVPAALAAGQCCCLRAPGQLLYPHHAAVPAAALLDAAVADGLILVGAVGDGLAAVGAAVGEGQVDVAADGDGLLGDADGLVGGGGGDLAGGGAIGADGGHVLGRASPLV
eukprot:1158443-Pelagomonas_calceolata.AAC.26